TSGTLTFAPGETSKTVLVPTINDNVGEGTETFTVNLSNPTGATIAHGQGTGTILDDDATKFLVLDGSGESTYRYGMPGNAKGSSSLAAGNTDPRGIAAKADGSMYWVVDGTGAVYVYNSGGTLLGSWTAGGLPAKSNIQGIATNGTDIWILDNKQ